MENETINGFELKYKLGEGGMAEVWYAENAVQKPAAVKILHKKFCEEPEIVSRFHNEARLMVQLNHPNIWSIQSFESINGRPALIMEYLEGADLSARMKQGERFSHTQLTAWWNDLSDALHFTHRKNIIHRDIKPSNLFLTEEGKIKLLDFGVAKLKDNITITQTGSRMGTLMYMSPEQVYDVKNLNYKTDIYSLAVTFYHLVTGKAPYDSTIISDFEIQESIVRKNIDTSVLPQPWRDLLPGFFYKNPEERKELRWVETDAKSSSDETIVVSSRSVPKETERTVPPVYEYPHQKSSRNLLIPILVVLGLVFFVLNKEKVIAFFSDRKMDIQKPKQEQPVSKTNTRKEATIADIVAVKPDTIVSNGTDGSKDEVIVNSGMTDEREKAIKNEINEYYISRNECDQLNRFFENVVVQYYNKSNVSLASIQKECETYHNKWKFTNAAINNDSYVFTLNPNGRLYIDFNMLYKIKQQEEDEWVMYNIDVAMVINENNKIERIAETRIERL